MNCAHKSTVVVPVASATATVCTSEPLDVVRHGSTLSTLILMEMGLYSSTDDSCDTVTILAGSDDEDDSSSSSKETSPKSFDDSSNDVKLPRMSSGAPP